MDWAKSVEMITWCGGHSNENAKQINGLYTLKGDEQINYSCTNLAASN